MVMQWNQKESKEIRGNEGDGKESKGNNLSGNFQTASKVLVLGGPKESIEPPQHGRPYVPYKHVTGVVGTI